MQKGRKSFQIVNARFLVVILLSLAFFLVAASPILALETGLEQVGQEAELGGADVRVIVARIINVFLGLLAEIALILVLYGGFLWMTAGGNPEQVEKAKKVLTNAAIGLAIILMSWAITIFVFNALLGEGGVFGTGEEGPPGAPTTYESFSGALGNGIIDYHYPARGAVDVPRNTKIMVTFKEEMMIESLISGYDDADTPLDTADDTVSRLLNTDNVLIYRSADGEEAALREDQVNVSFTDDLKTFVFQPVDWLGSASEDVSYTVSLGSGLESADGEDAFEGTLSDGYRWNFEVGTFVDVTPPQIRSVFPAAGESYPKNVLIQINFNEPVDPTSATGHTSRFTNIIVDGAGVVLGTFSIANQYKTVEFIPDEICGTNTCGADVHCLPGGVNFELAVRAATMVAGEEPVAAFPYNGIVDMAGNSLDGNGDGTAQGPPTDNYGWGFATTDRVYIEPPGVTSVSPGPGESEVAADQPIEIIWDVLMSLSSLNGRSIMLADDRTDGLSVWYTLDSDALTEEGSIVEEGGIPDHTLTRINHALLLEDTQYYPEIFSEVEDIYQNCFSPASTRSCSKDRTGAPWCCDTSPSSSRTSGPCLGIPEKDREF